MAQTGSLCKEGLNTTIWSVREIQVEDGVQPST